MKLGYRARRVKERRGEESEALRGAEGRGSHGVEVMSQGEEGRRSKKGGTWQATLTSPCLRALFGSPALRRSTRRMSLGLVALSLH
jgi:hypothetical protein